MTDEGQLYVDRRSPTLGPTSGRNRTSRDTARRHGRYFPAELAVWLRIPPQAAPGSRRGLSQRAAASWQMGSMSSESAHSGQERAQPRARADYRAQNSAVMSRVFHSPARCPRLKLRGSFSLTFSRIRVGGEPRTPFGGRAARGSMGVRRNGSERAWPENLMS